MGGELRVASELGVGTTFTLALETEAQDDAAERAAGERRVHGYGGRRRRVLVVDDNADNRAVLAGWLSHLGFTVEEAADGEAAVAAVARDVPDLVLMDLVMPGVDGLAATARIRALDPARRTALLEAIRGNLTTLADLPAELAPFVEESLAFEPAASEALASEGAAEVCLALASALAELAPWSGERVKSAVQSVGKRVGLKGRELFQPVRAALTGRTHGPELPLGP